MDKQVLFAFVDREGEVVIGPDQRRMDWHERTPSSMARASRFEFRFGPDSFVQHQQFATAAGFTMNVHFDAHLAFDIDDPADYRDWQLTDARCHRR